MPICTNGKALELGARCLISETFLYLNGLIYLTGHCLIGEVLRYMLSGLVPVKLKQLWPLTANVNMINRLSNFGSFNASPLIIASHIWNGNYRHHCKCKFVKSKGCNRSEVNKPSNYKSQYLHSVFGESTEIAVGTATILLALTNSQTHF